MLAAINDVGSILKDYELPWNIQRNIEQLTDVAPELLKQIEHFIKYGEVAPSPDKILSLHAKEVKCISKGKTGKPFEFGRTAFISRLPGNYVMAFTDDDFGLQDAYAMETALENYQDIFDQLPKSVAGDQGFWSRPNLKAYDGIEEIGITPRGHKNWKISVEKNRRNVDQKIESRTYWTFKKERNGEI